METQKTIQFIDQIPIKISIKIHLDNQKKYKMQKLLNNIKWTWATNYANYAAKHKKEKKKKQSRTILLFAQIIKSTIKIN